MPFYKHFFLLVLLFLMAHKGSAQNQNLTGDNFEQFYKEHILSKSNAEKSFFLDSVSKVYFKTKDNLLRKSILEKSSLNQYQLNNFQKAIKIELLLNQFLLLKNDTLGIIHSNSRLNAYYYQLTKWDSAYYYLSLNNELLEAFKNENLFINHQFALGNFYFKTGKSEQAKKVYQNLKQKDSLNPLVYTGLGNAYASFSDYENAISYYKKALLLDTNNITVLNKLGLTFKKQENYTQAVKYYYKALDKTDSLTNAYVYGAVNNNLGVSYYFLNEYSKALKYLTLGRVYSEKVNAQDFLGVSLEYLAYSYEKVGDYKNAYKYAQKFKTLSDSINSNEVKTRIANLENTFTLKDKEKELQLLESEKQSKSNQAKLFAILLVVLTIGIVIVLGLNQRLNKTKAELSKLNQIKDKFFAIIAHDLKNKTTGINNIGSIIIKYFNRGEPNRAEKIAKQLDEESSRLNELLDNLLNWSFVQINSLKISKTWVEPISIVQNVEETFKSTLLLKNITLDTIELRNNKIYTDPNILEFIVRNIVSNAIKFSQTNSTIKIYSSNNNHLYQLKIQDFGIGMNQKQLNQIFDITQKNTNKGTEGEKGNGLGLSLCNEFAEKIDAKMSVESTLSIGSTFTISFSI
jgi:signal transduction histidine kinase